MSHDYYECPLIAKSLKTDLELSPQPLQSTGLGLDCGSKRRHLDMVGHRKVDLRLAALRKLEELMRSSPEKYQGYLHKLWNLCENDQLIIWIFLLSHTLPSHLPPKPPTILTLLKYSILP